MFIPKERSAYVSRTDLSPSAGRAVGFARPYYGQFLKLSCVAAGSRRIGDERAEPLRRMRPCAGASGSGASVFLAVP